MYAAIQTHKADTEAGQNIVNAWLKQRIPDMHEEISLDLLDFFEFEKDKAVFSVEDWKWYPDYPEIKVLENIFKEFADTFCTGEATYAMEFIRIGEDWTDVEAKRSGNYDCRLDLHRTIYID
jgi:uncharacterized protein YdhG (YjbR/CyaY superfamily)